MDSPQEADTQANKGHSILSICGAETNSQIQVEAGESNDFTITKNPVSTQVPLVKKFSKSKIPVVRTKSIGNAAYNNLKFNAPTYTKSNENNQGKSSRRYDFIKKIMRIPKSPISSKPSESVEELFVRKINYEMYNNSKTENTKYSSLKSTSGTTRCNNEAVLPTSYIPHQKQQMNSTISDGLRELVDLNSRFHDSSMFIKDMIAKYIGDKRLETELLALVSEHSKLQIDTERHSQTLSNEMWIQQTQLFKNQELIMQETLDSLVKTNREIKEENYLLSKNNDKLNSKIAVLSDSGTSLKYRNSLHANNQAMEDLQKNNEKLRQDLSGIVKQYEGLENELKKLQKKNYFFEEQLGSSSSLLQKYKTSMERVKADHQLEVAKLETDYQMSGIWEREAIAIGDELLDDLEKLSQEIRTIPAVMNRDKFKGKGKSVVDLIQLCRLCIGELARDLKSKQAESAMQMREINLLKADNNKQKCRIQDFIDESTKTSKNIEDIKAYDRELNNKAKEIIDLESQLKIRNNIFEEKSSEFENQQVQLKKLLQELDDKDNALKEAQSYIESVNIENTSLQAQILEVSPVGKADITTELRIVNEKLSEYHEKYFIIAKENAALSEQIKISKREKEALVVYHRSINEHLQAQQTEMSNHEKCIATLKEQLEAEKHTCGVLQNERVRHLEERNVTSALYERLKGEVNKNGELEGTVTDMNKETSRLTIIAEFNKQVGEKLRNEVAERDITITQLQNSVKQLNEIQVESSIEKVSLCEELTQVCCMKEVLDCKLSEELQKNCILGKSKNEIENTTSTELNKLQGMYVREHIALKLLLDDVKFVIKERDYLLESNKTSNNKILEFEQEKQDFLYNYNLIYQQYLLKEEEIKNLEKQILANRLEYEHYKSVIDGKISEHTLQTDKITEMVTKENNDFRSTVKYLQKDVNLLRNELDQVKTSETNCKNLLEAEVSASTFLHVQLQEKLSLLQIAKNDNESLKLNLIDLENIYRNLVIEHEKIIQDSGNYEKQMEKEILNSKSCLSESANEIDKIRSELKEKAREIDVLQENCKTLSEQNHHLNQVFKDVNANSELLMESRNKCQQLHDALLKSHEEHSIFVAKITQMEEDMSVLKEQFDSAIKQIEDDSITHAETVGKIKMEYDTHLSDVKSNVTILSQKLLDATEEYNTEKQAKDKLQEAHKTLACKMLKSVRMLIKEKVSKEKLDTVVLLYKQDHDNMKSEVKRLKEHADAQKKELRGMYKKIENILKENESMKLEISEKQEENKELEKQKYCLAKEVSTIEEHFKVSKKKSSQSTVDTLDFDHSLSAKNSGRIDEFKSELKINHENTIKLQQELADVKKRFALTEFQKCEGDLRLHEFQGMLESNAKINKTLKDAAERTLTLVLQMREEGTIPEIASDALLLAVRNYATN